MCQRGEGADNVILFHDSNVMEIWNKCKDALTAPLGSRKP
jgi:hypothetical protein